MLHGADLLVANRAYGDHNQPRGDGDSVVAGAGGLVAAVASSIQPWDGSEGTLWIGAGRGSHDHEFVDERGREVLQTPRGPLLHQRLFFDDETWTGHYEEVANSFLWPALHLVRPDLIERAAFFPRPAVPTAAAWASYERANRCFAEAAAHGGRRSAWIHDYQLGLAPSMMRDAGFAGHIGFFLHTPFPSLEVVREAAPRAMEYFAQFIAGILGADLAGFQTERDRHNFVTAARELAGAQADASALTLSGRRVRTGAFPVGVNTDDVKKVQSGELPAEAGAARAGGLPLVVGLERADFTKGVPERLFAVARAYESGARFAYFGAASPTRQGVALYDGFGDVMNEAAAAAAEAASRAECPFVQQQLALSWPEVVALLREADVVFTSSLADGMNLVPLQAAIAQEGRRPRGVAISGANAGVALTYERFAGDGLAVVDPLDIDGTADTLVAAVQGRLPGMSDAFVKTVAARDSSHWAAGFMAALEGADAR